VFDVDWKRAGRIQLAVRYILENVSRSCMERRIWYGWDEENRVVFRS
jgi:hypothetical protein